MNHIVLNCVRNWPRHIFANNKTLPARNEVRDKLHNPGVYVLYHDRIPYYIGKTDGALYDRIYQHARVSADHYFNFWNYFSAFAIKDKRTRAHIEAILIDAMPSANGAKPKLKRLHMSRALTDWLREQPPTIF